MLRSLTTEGLTPRLDELIWFMSERHGIYTKRKHGKPYPWTEDPILQVYRFCNIYRELDTVTIWIRKNIREAYADHPNLWFMLAIARQINLPETLAELIADKRAWPTGPLHKFDVERVRKVMLARQARGDQLYTGAYMINNIWEKGYKGPTDKAAFTCHRVLATTIANESLITQCMRHSMRDTHQALMKGHGWGGFMSYEVVCDIRFTKQGEHWPDINTFSQAGPGAKRGLNRLYGRPLDTGPTDAKALAEMVKLYKEVKVGWRTKERGMPFELREIEHTLCEFDKLERVRLGEGRPRSKYHPEP